MTEGTCGAFSLDNVISFRSMGRPRSCLGLKVQLLTHGEVSFALHSSLSYMLKKKSC